MICLSAFLSDQKVLAIASIDKGVNVCSRQVLLGAVNVLSHLLPFLKMALKDGLRILRFEDIEVSRESLEVLEELFVANNLIEVCILSLERVALSAEHEGHLLLGYWVLAQGHGFSNEIGLVHLLSHAQGLGVLFVFDVDLVGSVERVLHLLCICCIVCAAQEIVADSLKVGFISEILDSLKALHFHEQVDGLGLLMVLHENRDNHVHQEKQVSDVCLAIGLEPLLIDLPDLARK